MPRDAQAFLWEDDYHEVVTEDEDGWGREGISLDADDGAGGAGASLPPPPWLAAAAAPHAAPPGPLQSAYSPEQGFRRAPPAALAHSCSLRSARTHARRSRSRLQRDKLARAGGASGVAVAAAGGGRARAERRGRRAIAR